MHMLRDFIDDRYSFWNRYMEGISPRRYEYKGVKKAFVVGSALDFAIKQYYTGDKTKLLDSKEFKSLEKPLDRTVVASLVNIYVMMYSHLDNPDKEYFNNYRVVNLKTTIQNRKLKNDYVIYSSPDMIADMYGNNELEIKDYVIIEIKSTADDQEDYNAETLDFQTMTYAWTCWRYWKTIPKYVIKRTLYKTRLRIKQKETENEFIKRVRQDILDNPEKYISSNYREVNLSMIQEYEKYLMEILFALDEGFKSNDKYKFWKKSGDYWGNMI